MSVLLLSTEPKGFGERLECVIEWIFPSLEVEICRTVETLSDRLVKPKSGLDVAVLAAESIRELEGLLSIQHLLDGVPIILVVPDSEPETIALGHKLRPRFLTDGNGAFVDLAAVLGKMLQHSQSHVERRRDERGWA